MTGRYKTLDRWTIMNTKSKMNIHQAIEWFNIDEMIIIRARRYSYRGANEEIYILGAYGTYGINPEDSIEYVSDTGNGYGGTGKLFIEDIMSSGRKYGNKIMSTHNIMELNEKVKLPIWVFK